MQTLAVRPGDPLVLAPAAGVGTEWRPTPPAVADNELAGRVFQLVDRASSAVLASTLIQVQPLHRTVLVESTREEITLGAPAEVNWTVVSLGLMQRVQRLLAWPTLVNDMRALVSVLLADEDVPPRGWEIPEVRDAMLRLVDTRNAADRKITLSDGATPVYVERVRSLAIVDKWSASPYRMIRRAGAGARVLLQNYLSIQYDPAVPPEVQIGQRDTTVTIDIAALTGPAPHNGASFVVVGHPGRGGPAIVYDVHVLPTVIDDVVPSLPLNLAPRSPSPFAAFVAYVRQQAPSMWNNYNVGWRATAAYAQPGTSVFDAVHSFNGDPRFPLVRTLGATAPLPSRKTGTLVFELSDFGDDPFLAALIGVADVLQPQRGDRDSFGIPNPAAAADVLLPGWAPRRLAAAGFVDQLAVAVRESAEQEPTNEEQIERRQLRKQIAAVIGSSSLAIVADKLTASRTEVMQAFVEEDDRTVSTAKLAQGLETARRGLNDSFLDLFAKNYLLADALRQEIGLRGRPCIVPLLQRAALLVGQQGTKSSATLSNAQTIIDELQSRLIRLSYMASQYRGVPAVNENLGFEDIAIGAMKRSNARIDQSDVEFIESFSKPRLSLLLAEPENQKTFQADYQPLKATVAPVPPVARPGRRGFPAAGGAPLPPAAGGAKQQQQFGAGWAFGIQDDRSLWLANQELNLGPEGTQFWQRTGIRAIPTMRNVVVPPNGTRLPVPLENYVRGKTWVPLEFTQAGSLLEAVLRHTLASAGVDPRAAWAPEVRARPDLVAVLDNSPALTPASRVAASKMLAATGLARLPTTYDPASRIATTELADFVANGWSALEDIPAASLIPVILLHRLARQQSVQPAATTVPTPQPQPPQVVPAVSRRQVLEDAFGPAIAAKFSDDQIDNLDADTVANLLPLEAASAAGYGLFNTLDSILNKDARERLRLAREADEAQRKREEAAAELLRQQQQQAEQARSAATETGRRLGFPGAIQQAIASAPKETQEAFARLTPLDSLSLVRLGRTLQALLGRNA